MRIGRAIVAVSAIICATAAMFSMRLSTSGTAKDPPIIPLPMSTVEPPRDVTAESWKSPYCAHWNDGCTECFRSSRDETPKCSEERDSGRSETMSQGGGCKRRAIICFKEMDATYFDRICERFLSELYFKTIRGTKKGAITCHSYLRDVEWRFDGSKFISERVNPWVHCDGSRCLVQAVGPGRFLLSDGYMRLSGTGNEYLPASFVFGRNTLGLRCTKSYELRKLQ